MQVLLISMPISPSPTELPLLPQSEEPQWDLLWQPFALVALSVVVELLLVLEPLLMVALLPPFSLLCSSSFVKAHLSFLN